MGFTSMDDLIYQITVNGKAGQVTFMKTTNAVAGVAGSWKETGLMPGYPVASTYGAADLTFTATDDTWSEGAVYHGGDVSPATKHFTSASGIITAAAGAPWVLGCVDQVGYVKLSGANVSSTGAKVVTMTAIGSSGAKVDRYANGEGLRMYMSASGALGANAPTCIVNYLDTGGAAGATTTFTSTAFAADQYIINSGSAANKYNPFLPLANGDTGVSDIVNVTWAGTAHASGTVILHLVKPLFFLPLPASGLLSVMDFVNTLPSLPRIRDGANLKFILWQAGATTASVPLQVNFDYAYGG
jgi:hypothetical protein